MMRFLSYVLVGALAPGILAAGEIAGQLEWSERIVLSTPVSGVVASVPVAPGQSVASGQTLLKLDDRRFQADLVKAKAQVERLRLTVEEAEREYERARELYDRTVISARDLQLAEIDLAMAKADYAASKAELTAAQVDLEHSVLRAPFDAIVLETHVAAGETVANELTATPMISLAASGRMLARATVDESQLEGLREGEQIEVIVGSERVPGTLSQIGLEPVRTESGVKYDIKVSFQPSAGKRLRVGQSVRLELP